MRQRLHLLIVDADRRTALAARYGPRWLLPVIECAEMVRAGPLVARWCAARGVANDVAGQWFGRMDGESTDWLMVMPSRGVPPGGSSLEWVPLNALASGRSVLDYQTWALRRSLQSTSLPATTGPFGTIHWPQRVRSWMADTLKLLPLAWTPYRTSASEAVMGFETPHGRCYFKGLAADRVSEPAVTQRCAAIAPESFARTLALEHRDDGAVWWVTAECRGDALSDPVRVATDLARLQCRLGSVAREFPRLPVDDIERDFAPLPQSWIPMDLDPSNVLFDGEHVRFIDLDDSFLGPAPLAVAAFARRCCAGTERSVAYSAYEMTWGTPLGTLDWNKVEDAALVCQSELGWIRVVRNVERGELHADLDVLGERIRRRLARQLQRG